MTVIKDSKEEVVQLKTKKECTRGKKVHLHKYWKGIAAGILDKKQRRQYLNMMIDAVESEKEGKMRKNKDKGSEKDE